ncbi:MAG: nucleoside-diphosphate sugar epimerase/dehydratase [Acholeplasmataceae bacterium]|jgi:FlaA1/EpsC-like NDP-sugar epimerase|nr:nucleoside-diphosphate sugar epimerase/dehydratase [Acholeplasmataceae bacterium]
MKNSKAAKIVQVIKIMSFDALAIAATYFIAYLIFVAIGMTENLSYRQLIIAIPFIALFKIIVFYFFGFYSMLANHVGFEDVMKISLISIISNIAIVIFIFASDYNFMYKSAFIFITPLEVVLVTFPRIINRIVGYIKTNMDWNNALGRRTLIIGAGSAGEIVVKEIYKNKDLNNLPVAFLDDDPKKQGNRLSGIKIVGPISQLKETLEDLKIEEVIISIANIPLKKYREMLATISEKNIKIKRLTVMSDVDSQTTKIVDVKIEDLLNRDEIKLDDAHIKDFIKDEVVLVTGGGGSIGSELCRQISELQPKKLIIFDIYENNAYDIQQELLRKFQKQGKHFDLVVRIGSVYNEIRTEEIFRTFKPTIVFHAAAYKHVPLMEDSAVEAVRTNVIGTYNVSSLANKYQVKKFVLVSSDKAVRSTNVMGATKRYAELIIQEQQNHSEVTKFSAVRFGNVLGSNGSVIPLFKKQIADGGPVTVTHPDITRYFMTIPEAVGLILQCGVYAKGGEVFILDMGEPVKIRELAEKMIRLAGYRPYNDIQIEYTGLRPGEKLYEELLVDHNHEDQCRTDNEKIFIEKQREVTEADLELNQIKETLESLKNCEVKDFVAKIITTYKRNGD